MRDRTPRPEGHPAEETYQGEEHQPGESYDVPAAEVDNLVGQGLVTTTAPPPPPAPPVKGTPH